MANKLVTAFVEGKKNTFTVPNLTEDVLEFKLRLASGFWRLEP